jgi:hypothetical protein
MGLGGPERQLEVKGEELAFDNLKEELKRQDTFRSIDIKITTFASFNSSMILFRPHILASGLMTKMV